MDAAKYISKLKSLQQGILSRNGLIAVLAAVVLIQAAHLKAKVGDDRTHFIPPEVTKPFWLSADEASPEYFEDMGQFIGLLPLNVTPETAAQACKQYLSYILPKDRDKYRSKCDVQISRIKRDDISQMFSVSEVFTDVKHRKVALVGKMSTYINGKLFPAREAYLLEFERYGGRFYVKQHEQVDPDDPFNGKKIEK